MGLCYSPAEIEQKICHNRKNLDRKFVRAPFKGWDKLYIKNNNFMYMFGENDGECVYNSAHWGTLAVIGADFMKSDEWPIATQGPFLEG